VRRIDPDAQNRTSRPRLFTGAAAEDPLAGATARFLDNEFGRDDATSSIGSP
jgi:hypothetical protein